jgi:hypothetical protein
MITLSQITHDYLDYPVLQKSENPSHGQCEDGFRSSLQGMLVLLITARSAPEAEREIRARYLLCLIC